jgi:hypothetical protein
LSAVGALNGNLVYKRKTKQGKPAICMRRVGGKLLRASHLPLSSCFPSDMGLDAKGRVVAVFARGGTKHGQRVLHWYGYDVKGNRIRLLEGVPKTSCPFDLVLTWRTRIVYGLSCSSQKRNGLWVKEGKTARRILDMASYSNISGLTLRGGTLAGFRLVGLYDFGVYQLMIDGKPCVRTIVSPWDDFQNKEIFGIWIANGNIVWSGGYFPGYTAGSAIYRGLFTSTVPSHCTAPGPNGRFDFNPETSYLKIFTVDGRQVYYAGKNSIRSHTLPVHPAYAPPGNDKFENAQSVTVGGASGVGETAHATVQPGEPLPNSSQTIWYTFTPATDGPVSTTVDDPEGARGQFAVYTGTSLGTLSPVAGPAPTSSAPVQFNAQGGRQYWIDLGTSDPQANYRPFYVSVKTP